jgi:hypothetical protein
MQSSGKLVILGILTVALASAAASWWFRYKATSQAVKFWGPTSARLIRDAPKVELYRWSSLPASAFRSSFSRSYLESANGRDLSNTPGLTHLRNALLEDRSYRWPAEPMTPDGWGWVLVFREVAPGKAAILFFSRDWKFVGRPGGDLLSCEPIADGLAEMLGELAPTGEPAR